MMIAADGDAKVTMHAKTALFRQVPVAKVFDDSNARIRNCAAKRGHVLAMRNNKIVCTECEAEWQDYGC